MKQENSIAVKPGESCSPGLLSDNTGLRLVAHRGMNELAPEATLPAYELAGRHGMWGLKIDLCETEDGAFVCSHDWTVDRIFDGQGLITELSLAQLLDMRVVRGANVEKYPGQKIVQLDEALEICSRYRMHPYLNFKLLRNRFSVARVLDIIRDHGLLDDTLCSCNGDIVEYLYALREVTDVIPIVFWLWDMNLVYGLPVIRTLGNACLSINVLPQVSLTQFENYAETLKDLGMPVCAAMMSRKQLPQLKQWMMTTDIALLVTSGITYADLNPGTK